MPAFWALTPPAPHCAAGFIFISIFLPANTTTTASEPIRDDLRRDTLRLLSPHDTFYVISGLFLTTTHVPSCSISVKRMPTIHAMQFVSLKCNRFANYFGCVQGYIYIAFICYLMLSRSRNTLQCTVSPAIAVTAIAAI